MISYYEYCGHCSVVGPAVANVVLLLVVFLGGRDGGRLGAAEARVPAADAEPHRGRREGRSALMRRQEPHGLQGWEL